MDTASMKRLLVMAALLALAGCGGDDLGATSPSASVSSTTTSAAPSTSAPPPPFAVVGRIEVTGGYSATGQVGETCWMTGGYDDIAIGAQVVVSDETGAKVAVGDIKSSSLKGEGVSRSCVFTFLVPGVPAGHGLYSVEVAHRGELTYTEAELQSDLSLTLG